MVLTSHPKQSEGSLFPSERHLSFQKSSQAGRRIFISLSAAFEYSKVILSSAKDLILRLKAQPCQYTMTFVLVGQLFQIHLASSTLRRTQPWEALLPRWLTELWVTLPSFWLYSTEWNMMSPWI